MGDNIHFMNKALEGAEWLKTPGAPDIRQALPYIATSDNADAWLIGAWCQYWSGGIVSIHKTRGHMWEVINRFHQKIRVRISNPYDHRAGVILT